MPYCGSWQSLGMGVTDQTEMALEQMASSRLSTSVESLPRTQHSQSDAITNDTDGFTLSKHKSVYYQKFLVNHLHSAVWWKHLHFFTGALPLALHDNAHSHVSKPVTDLLAKWQWETLEHSLPTLNIKSLWYRSVNEDEWLLTGKQFCSMEGAMETTELSVADTKKNQPTDGICQHTEIWYKFHYVAGNGSFQVNKAVMYVQHILSLLFTHLHTMVMVKTWYHFLLAYPCRETCVQQFSFLLCPSKGITTECWVSPGKVKIFCTGKTSYPSNDAFSFPQAELIN